MRFIVWLSLRVANALRLVSIKIGEQRKLGVYVLITIDMKPIEFQ